MNRVSILFELGVDCMSIFSDYTAKLNIAIGRKLSAEAKTFAIIGIFPEVNVQFLDNGLGISKVYSKNTQTNHLSLGDCHGYDTWGYV